MLKEREKEEREERAGGGGAKESGDEEGEGGREGRGEGRDPCRWMGGGSERVGFVSRSRKG